MEEFVLIKVMQIVTLTRQNDNGIETLGDLVYNDFKCKTLELSWKENQSNISCIPLGTYECKYTFSLKLGWTYEVLNVHNRSGIRIHKGNYFFNVTGCILLGSGYSDINSDKQTDVINSISTLKEFEQLLNKQPFFLIITVPAPTISKDIIPTPIITPHVASNWLYRALQRLLRYFNII